MPESRDQNSNQRCASYIIDGGPWNPIRSVRFDKFIRLESEHFTWWKRVVSIAILFASWIHSARLFRRVSNDLGNVAIQVILSFCVFTFPIVLNLRSPNGSFSGNLLRKQDRSTFVSIPFFLVEHDRSISSRRFSRIYLHDIIIILSRR